MKEASNKLSSLRSEYRSITRATCDKLREAIIQGVFAPGEPLRERELADLMGVSTTPVKAALQRLAVEGLVSTVAMRGSFVADNVASILSEFGLIRAALEGTTAFLAAMKATDDDLAALGAQIELMQACTKQRDIERAIQANAQFHKLILDISRNNTLKQMSEIMRHYDDITRPQALADERQMVQGLAEHRAVFEAIATRDPELADAKMREHILRNTQFIEDRAAGTAKDGRSTSAP